MNRELNSTPRRNGPSHRNVLLRWRLPNPRFAPRLWIQGPLPDILHTKGLRDAHSPLRPHRRRHRRRRRRRSDLPLRTAHPIPFEPILPAHALRNEHVLGRRLNRLCSCHYRHNLHDLQTRRLHCTFPILISRKSTESKPLTFE